MTNIAQLLDDYGSAFHSAMIHGHQTLTRGTGIIERADTARKALADEFERLTRWVAELQSGMYVNCVYCGHRYGPGETTPVSMADALKAHVEQCPQHPMSALKVENERLERERENAVKVSQDVREEWLTLMHEIQRYQPAGSPPPGGGLEIAKWVLGSLAAENERLREESRQWEKESPCQLIAERNRLRESESKWHRIADERSVEIVRLMNKLNAVPVHFDPTGTTREPPHCPTCSCGMSAETYDSAREFAAQLQQHTHGDPREIATTVCETMQAAFSGTIESDAPRREAGDRVSPLVSRHETPDDTQDARRYRWLRMATGGDWDRLNDLRLSSYGGEAIDGAIDAAMERENSVPSATEHLVDAPSHEGAEAATVGATSLPCDHCGRPVTEHLGAEMRCPIIPAYAATITSLCDCLDRINCIALNTELPFGERLKQIIDCSGGFAKISDRE